MNIRPIVFYLFLLNLILTFPCLSQAQTIGDYDVVWRSPSSDASGAMPLGNGELGINLWVEPSGDLLFYLSRTDSWSETGRLLKLGKVRVSLSPNPFAAGSASLNGSTSNRERSKSPANREKSGRNSRSLPIPARRYCTCSAHRAAR